MLLTSSSSSSASSRRRTRPEITATTASPYFTSPRLSPRVSAATPGSSRLDPYAPPFSPAKSAPGYGSAGARSRPKSLFVPSPTTAPTILGCSPVFTARAPATASLPTTVEEYNSPEADCGADTKVKTVFSPEKSPATAATRSARCPSGAVTLERGCLVQQGDVLLVRPEALRKLINPPLFLVRDFGKVRFFFFLFIFIFF